MKGKYRFISLVILVLSVFAVFAAGCGGEQQPAEQPSAQNGGIVLYNETEKSNIFVDQDDHAQVLRVAEDLRKDIRSVTGGTVEVKTDAPSGKYAVIVGTLGKSDVVDSVIASGKFDEAKAIEGKWECYAMKLVDQPCAGVERALVIAGSDKRGTIYGVYTVSEKIGVSPWYYFADVTPVKQESLVFQTQTVVSDEPSVKYRGIFINDEFNFSSWAKMYSNGTGAPNAEVYGRVFELLLRLKANTLWPGMHGVSTAFYKDKGADGISLNAKAADEYGVVMGTSHCEQCMRNNVGEWQDWIKANSGKYGLPDVSGYSLYADYAALYDFSLYPAAVTEYWKERLIEAKEFESLITIGMRGVHDEGFSYAGLKDKGFASRVELLQSVIDTQIGLIEEIYGEDYEEKVQLVYIPYKEAADYYYGTENGVDYGVKISLPESTLLMWADDNYGYVRQTPDPDEIVVNGGYSNMGVYYHISYVGVPCVYIWTDVAAYGTIYEEMKKSYDAGSTGYWIVNVGDIKPCEYGMEYFLQLAYDIDEYDDTQYERFMTERALRDFTSDEALSSEIGELVVSFKQVAETYRSDYAGKDNMPSLSHVANGDEAMKLVHTLEAFEQRAERIYNTLSAEKKDAFFQTVYYAIRAELYSVQRYVYAERTQVYYNQGRYAAAAEYGKAALAAQENLEADVLYYNNTLSDGKWYGMMDEFIGGAYYGAITREELEWMIIPVSEGYGTEGVGAVCEGQERYAEGGTLSFSSLGNETRFIDVYSLGSGAASYSVEKPNYIVMNESGSVGAEERLCVSVDWSLVTSSRTDAVKISDNFGNVYTFSVQITVNDVELRDKSYIILNGVASIEAERYSQNIAGEDGTYWETVEGLGRSGSSVKVFPDTVTAPTADYEKTAKLIYSVYAEEAGVYTGTLYRIPTLNESGSSNLAIGVGTRTPQLVSGTYRTGQGSWSASVMPRIEKLTFSVFLAKGYNDLTVYRSDPFLAFDKIVLTASGISDDSYYGIAETYNTFSYTAPTVAELLGIGTASMPETLEKDRYVFNFGEMPALTSYYTHVPVTHSVYNDATGFGFATVQQANSPVAYYRSAYLASDRNRSFVFGTGEAQFKVAIANGVYSVAIVSADGLTDGLTAETTLSVNGVQILTKKAIAAGGVMEYYALAEVTDGIMRFDLSGSWILNAIEIYPYTETDTGGSGEFVVSAGGGYIEAESALENSSFAWTTVGTGNGREWTETAGVSGSALFCGADSSKNNTNISKPTGASLNYRVTFQSGGLYYFWALVKAPSADDDSFHIGWDGAYRSTFNPSKRDEGFAWVYTRFSIRVEAGSTHTVTVWQREDGIVIDKLCFSPYYSYYSANKSASDQFPVNGIGQVRTLP